MVFVPVALTWKAVSEATAAFGKFIDSNSASTVNFLAFWQNGYDILPKFWTISHVASLDFLIIAAVILLSIASTFLTQKSQADRRENSYSAGQERIQMALALKIYLYSMREIDKGNIKEGIASSVSALQSATSALTKTAIELNTIMSGLKKSIPAVNDFGVRMQEETAKLNRQVAKLTDNFANINGSIIEELRSAVSSASDGLRLANDELNDSTESIRKNANDAEREIRTLQGVIKRASKLGK
jgi:ABC-type transporter Mla subunit MlaD